MDYIGWLYLATRLDGIKEFFGWLTFLAFLTVLIAWIVIAVTYAMTADDSVTKDEKTLKIFEDLRSRMYPWRKWAIGVFILVGFIYAATPTKKDAMFIAGGVGVIEGAKALHGSEIAKKSVAIVEQWLENNLNELRDRRSDGKKAK